MLFHVKPPKGVNLSSFNFDSIPVEYFTSFVISKIDIEKFKQQARKIKREKKISHQQALDAIAVQMKFNHWKHLLSWREKSEEIEWAFHKGCVMAFDSGEQVDIDDGSIIEIDRSAFAYLFEQELRKLYGQLIDEDSEDRLLMKDTHTASELDLFISDEVEGMDFYRVAPSVYFRSLKQALKIVQDRCFWLPNMMLYRGCLIDTHSLPTRDSNGNVVGFRY
ncbi:hypothetical protein ABC502_14060 [Alkalimonas sp. NCh-2]|uniref:hypothetical protein n=1 Tax=Alkalimonas sp. NCh-2 TaxID=3144846 RepID=UPI0031F60B53